VGDRLGLDEGDWLVGRLAAWAICAQRDFVAGVRGMGVRGMGVRGMGVHGMGVCGTGVRGMGVRGMGVRGLGVRGTGVRGALRALLAFPGY
jgi:hypothetical protein